MAEAAKLPLSETPEFQSAVSKKVDEMAATLRAEIHAQLAAGRGDGNWTEELAMAIAQLTDQGTGRRRVAPEVMRQRELARERMTNLIVEARTKCKAARAAGDLDEAARWFPLYRLVSKTQLADRLIDPAWIDSNHRVQPTDINWDSVPNEAMEPLNEIAQKIHAAFRESIGSISKQDQVLQQPLKMTKGGVVVRGPASAAAHETTLSRVQERTREEEGLAIRHKDQPGRYKDVQILGTAHPPARQSI